MRFRRKIRFYHLILLIIFIIPLLVIYQNYKLQQIISNVAVKPTCYDDYVNTSIKEIDFQKDILVFLHIQKTAGTYWESTIFENLLINKTGYENMWVKACNFNDRKGKYECALNRYEKPFFWNTYKSRFCDIHAGYAELFNCLRFDYFARRPFPSISPAFIGIAHFITMLRDPIERYVSEFRHVKTGDQWVNATRLCVEQPIYSRKCGDWRNKTWQEFLTCEYNQANNRQVRMLADYNELGCRVLRCWTSDANCSTSLKRRLEEKLLESAKRTLLSMSFYGLAEYQILSQYLFENTFQQKMRFNNTLIESQNLTTRQLLNNKFSSSIKQIKANNHLDIELYDFAKTIFLKRIEYFMKSE